MLWSAFAGRAAAAQEQQTGTLDELGVEQAGGEASATAATRRSALWKRSPHKARG
jgi:hypothetical protein